MNTRYILIPPTTIRTPSQSLDRDEQHTLASGRHIKIGETLDKPLIEGHIKQLRQDLSFGQKEDILEEYLKPAPKAKRTISNVVPRPSSRRRNTNEDDDRSLSTMDTENSNASKRSDNRSRHSGEFNTLDPTNKNEPMRSPILVEDGRFIHRREHIGSSLLAGLHAVATTPDFFRQKASTSAEDTITLFDKRRPFIHSAASPYPLQLVSFEAFRTMMCDCVAHWRGGTRVEDVILWACWSAAFRQDFLKLWQAQCADSQHHPHRKDGMYIELYGHFDEQHFASMTASNILYPLFTSLMPRRTEVSARDCLYPKLEELADDEISHFLERHATYARRGLYGYLAHLTIITDAWFAALAEIKHIATIMEWWLDDGWIRVFPKPPDRTKCFTHALEKAYAKYSKSALNLYGLWTMWETPSIKGRVHLSHLISAKKAEAVCTSSQLTPLHAYMPKFMDMAKLPPHFLKAAHGPDEADNTPTTTTATSNSSKKHSHPSGKKVNFGSLRHSQDTPDQSPATSSSASTITCTDNDWDPEDDSSVRQIVNDPANERLIAQLTALVAATSISQPPRAPALQQHRPSDRPRTAYGDRDINDVKASSRTSYGDARDTRPQRADAPIDRACYSYFVHGTCPRADDCRYSHDKEVVNDARLACISNWKLGEKAVFNNFNIVNDNFPLETDTSNGRGYS